jgi:hypothetical protein
MLDGVTADYVRARWAYSELPSGRYSGQAFQRVPFDQLGKAEHYLLVDQFDRVRGKGLLLQPLLPRRDGIQGCPVRSRLTGRGSRVRSSTHLQAVDRSEAGEATQPRPRPVCGLWLPRCR